MNRRLGPITAILLALAASSAALPALSAGSPGRAMDVVQFGNSMEPGFGINAVAWMPDGRRAVTLGQDGRTIYWDTAGPWVVARGGKAGWSHSLSIAPDGRFGVETGEPDPAEPHTQFLDLSAHHTTTAFRGRPRIWIGAGRSRLLLTEPEACRGSECRLAILDPASVTADHAPIQDLGDRFGDGAMLAVSPDGARFAGLIAGFHGAQILRAWSSVDLSEIAEVRLGVAAVSEIGFDATGGRMYARDAFGVLHILDLATRRLRRMSLALPPGARVLATDLGAGTVLVASGTRGAGTLRYGVIGMVSGRELATARGRLVALFPDRGAVVVERDGQGALLDFSTTGRRSLGGGFEAVEDLDDAVEPTRIIAQPSGPALDLSRDGRNLVSTDGWWEPVGDPAARRSLTGFQRLRPHAVWLSPDGRIFAFDLDQGSPSRRSLAVFDTASGRLRTIYDAATPDLAWSGRGGWLAGGRFALVTDGGQVLSVSLDRGAAPFRLPAEPPGVSFGDVSPYNDPAAACSPIPATRRQNDDVYPRGYSRPTCVFWELIGGGQLVLTSTRDWTSLGTLYIHPDGGWLFQSRGRYDSSGGPEAPDLRWQVPDQPWGSLPSQTYMRDFYLPRLLAKSLDCNASGDCAPGLGPLPEVSALNWVLPKVAITRIAAAADAERVSVMVRAGPGHDPGAPEGRRNSGLYDLRLFRDGRLVGRWPDPKPPPPGAAAADLVKTWVADTRLLDALDPAAGTIEHTFTVALPTRRGAGTSTFTAYAFNVDRVKGETSAPVAYPLAPPSPRRRRAYVIAIGVDSYPAMPDHALSFAVRDAQTLARRLDGFIDTADHSGRGPAYVVVPRTFVSRGALDQAKKADIRAVLDILAGKPDGDDDRAISADRLDVTDLERATPDDLVILSFSGHGWAGAIKNSKGDFYLLPSDAQAPDPAHPDSLNTLISTAELTDWLRDVDAGEMVMVIDACHSAASVAADGFRPGPMGDPGLGPLAYDKGIRVLAATQADDVALESDALGGGHGLLTYVLVDRALADPEKGGVERDADGGVRIDALLNYVVDRMPALAASLRATPTWLVGAGADGKPWSPMLGARNPQPAGSPHVQQPALFDFTGRPSPVAVRPTARLTPQAPDHRS